MFDPLRSLRAGLCGIAVTLAALLAPAAPAFAHAAFLGSTPAPGARLGSAPSSLELRFTEALNRRLSTATVYSVATNRPMAASVSAPSATQIVVRPARRLGRGAYRVEWHSVAADDGHALEGSFSLGVRAAAVGAARTGQSNVLAGGGWVRAFVRAVFYPAILLFAGALMLGLPWSSSGRSWLLPEPLARRLGPEKTLALERRQRTIVTDAGLLAVLAATGVALLDTADAAGGLSASAVRSFLLESSSGLNRLFVVLFLIVAVSAARVLPRVAAMAGAGALAALALAGHASSVSPRGLAVSVDWLHLIAVAVWLGGIALLVVTLAPVIGSGQRELRLIVMRHVLPRFGRVALPAFAVVIVAGGITAYLDLGRVSALWDEAYGRVLLIKMALVGAIATASFMHAMRLRPRLLAFNPHPPEQVERRHWRLLRSEPLLGLAVAAVVALLVAFPVPRNGGGVARASATAAPCDPCPLPTAKPFELPVAESAGTNIVAAWIRRAGAGLAGEVRILDGHGKAAQVPFEIERASGVAISCGPGCRRFGLRSASPVLQVTVTERRRDYTARLPTGWQPRLSRRARTLLERAQATMRSLRSLREVELVNSVPGLYALTRYRLQAPNRFAYVTSVLHSTTHRTETEARSVVIGKVQWDRARGDRWHRGTFGGGLPFKTRSWFSWTPYAQAVRLLDQRAERGHRVAEVALMDPGTPAWWRLVIDLRTHRVLRSRLITTAHFMTQRYFDINAPLTIRPPRGAP